MRKKLVLLGVQDRVQSKATLLNLLYLCGFDGCLEGSSPFSYIIIITILEKLWYYIKTDIKLPLVKGTFMSFYMGAIKQNI